MRRSMLTKVVERMSDHQMKLTFTNEVNALVWFDDRQYLSLTLSFPILLWTCTYQSTIVLQYIHHTREEL